MRQATVSQRRELSATMVQVAVDQRQLRTRRNVVFGWRGKTLEFEFAIGSAIRVVLKDNSGIEQKK
jgi:hypothetical protein